MLYSLELFLLILIVFDLLKNKKIYTPGVIFNGIFFITLFLYGFYLSHIQNYLCYETLWVMLFAVAAFNIPVFHSYYKKKSLLLKPHKQTKFTMSSKKEMVIFYITLAMFVLELLYSKGCPLLWKLTGDARVYVNFGIPSFNGLFYSLVVVMGAYSIFKKGCIYKYFYLMFGLLVISRQVLISMVVQGALVYIFTHKFNRKLIITLIVGCIVGIILFSVMGNMRTGEDMFLAVAQFKPKADWIPTSFKWIYSYMCFSISNIDNLIRMTPGCVNYGATIFNSLMPTAFNLTLPINQGFNYLIDPNFNVSTFMPDIYIDFGVLGIAIFCLALGYAGRYFYRRVKEHDKVSVLIYAVICHNILLLFFTNMFLYLPIMFEFVLIPLIFMVDYGKLIKKIKNKINKILKRKGEN